MERKAAHRQFDRFVLGPDPEQIDGLRVMHGTHRPQPTGGARLNAVMLPRPAAAMPKCSRAFAARVTTPIDGAK